MPSRDLPNVNETSAKQLVGDIQLHPEDYGRARRAAQLVGLSLDDFISLAIHIFSRDVLNGMIPCKVQSAADLAHVRECRNAVLGVGAAG
jgi:hypothetical protein